MVKTKILLVQSKKPKKQTHLGFTWCRLLQCLLMLPKHSKILNPCVFGWLLFQQIWNGRWLSRQLCVK